MSSRSQGLLPGTASIGQPFLVDDASLCVANVESVAHPPLRTLRAVAAPLLAWEGRRLVGVWNPEAACYDAALGWHLASADASATSANATTIPASCVAVTCGSAAVCGAGGLSSDCSVLDSLNVALGMESAAAWDATVLSSTVREAATAANATAHALEGLAAERYDPHI